MTVILSRAQNKAQSLAAIEQILHLFVFPGVTEANRQLIAQHLDWMRRNPDDLRVNCRLETDPPTQTTKIGLELSFSPKLAPLKGKPQ